MSNLFALADALGKAMDGERKKTRRTEDKRGAASLDQAIANHYTPKDDSNDD